MDIRRTEQADLDLIDIWVFIAHDNTEQAERFIDRIEQRYEQLRQQPELGRMRPEFGNDIRVLVEGNYLIFYRVRGQLIEILRCLNGARDITAQSFMSDEE
ncbi:MAG: type II toxin-antitoxin system RelE/ParE family toxin [Cyanobacteria bacterium P01_E01_bin.6]